MRQFCQVRQFLMALILLLTWTASHADPEMDIRNQIKMNVARDWSHSDYAALDNMAEGYVSTNAKTMSGKSRLTLFYKALAGQLQIGSDFPDSYRIGSDNCDSSCTPPQPQYYGYADNLWQSVDQKTRDWVKKFPASPHAIIARAIYLNNRGWFYRGNGYAESVPPEGWKKFSYYNQQERELLESTYTISSKDPHWFELMFRVASDQSWSAPQWDVLVKRYLHDGKFYSGALNLIFYRMLPKWGGSIEEMERFAQHIRKIAPNGEGSELYARLYWNIAEEFPRTFFQDTKADWPTLRDGFFAMIKKYPDPRNKNGLAIFACLAGDVDTMRSEVAQLGPRLSTDLWSPYISYGECADKARIGK